MQTIPDPDKLEVASAIQQRLRPSDPPYIWYGHLGVLLGQWVERGFPLADAKRLTVQQCDAWIASGSDLPERGDVLPIGDDQIRLLMARSPSDEWPADERPPLDDIGGILDLGCQFGQRRQTGVSESTSFYECGEWLVGYYGGANPWPAPPRPIGPVRLLQGHVRPLGRSFQDDSGPRIVHGCSDFAALVKYWENRDKYLRELDITAEHQQYTRCGWRLNGWKWAESGLTIDPMRDSWFEDALCGVLEAHQQRGLKVNLSSFDMNNWSDSDMDYWFRLVAEICRDFGPDLVWLSGCTNEMEGTWQPGECPENIEHGQALMGAWASIYPYGCQAVSDPKDRNKQGMQALARNVALIHDQRWAIADAIRHAFNTMYENYPGVPVVQDEPTGPNGSPPHNDFTRLVYQPIEDPDELFALYTMHVLTGQASTYFNDPALVSREPLDSTWGFKELPQLWHDLAIPQDIGQGRPGAGHAGGMMQVNGSHAGRADGQSIGNYHLGVISGEWDGSPWAVRANLDAQWSVWYADGKSWEGHLSPGEVIPVQKGFTPAVVRALA